jgi:hypothetical protein
MTEPTESDSLSRVELPGSANTADDSGRQLHEHTSQFQEEIDSNTEFSPAACEVCNCAIPPNRSRCPDHSQDEAVDDENRHEWRISHIGLAVVPAVNSLHAAALGASAFKGREGAPGTKESFDLLYDFGEPADILTDGWGGGLPDVVSYESERGSELVATALAKSSGGGSMDLESGLEVDASVLGNEDPYVFTRRGKPLWSAEDLEAYADENEESTLWVVPGLLYSRELVAGDNPVKHRECRDCGETTKHVFDGYKNGHPSLHSDGAGRWICLDCETVDLGEAPVNPDVDEPWNNDNFAGGDRHYGDSE